MATLTNSVHLIGHLGQDPKTFNFDNGGMKVSFSMATNDYRKDKDGNRVEETQWHHIVAFGNTAKIAEEYLHKGSEIGLKGKLTYNQWEDKEGNKRYSTEIIANEILMLDKKS